MPLLLLLLLLLPHGSFLQVRYTCMMSSTVTITLPSSLTVTAMDGMDTRECEQAVGCRRRFWFSHYDECDDDLQEGSSGATTAGRSTIL
jgi:hypothetical protein